MTGAMDQSPPALAARLAHACGEWIKAGCTVADKATVTARANICADCEHWDGDARMGTGKCGLCGCSALKLLLPTSECPAGKWNHAKENDMEKIHGRGRQPRRTD